MTVISPTITGHTAMPYTGAPRCGYMRPIHHHCKDLSCPLQSTMVMVLAPGWGRAIEACHRLWDTRGKQLVGQRYEVRAETYSVNNEGLEDGLLRDDPESWALLRSMVEEQEKVIHLSNVGALLTPAGSPGEIWVEKSPPVYLPKDARPGRPQFEDGSWLDGDLEPPEFLIDEPEEPDESEEGESEEPEEGEETDPDEPSGI